MAASVRLSEAIERWERAMRGDLAQGTIRDRMVTMRKFERLTGNLYVKSVDHSHVDEFFSTNSHWGTGTRNKIRLHLSAFFKWLIERRMYVAANPMVGRRRTESPHKKHIHLTDEQVNEMLDSCEDPRDRILVAAQYYLSLRTSEVLPVKWGDLSDDRKRVNIWRSKKGRPYQQEVAVRGLLRQEFHTWQISLCRELGVARPDPEWFIFCQKKTGRKPGPSHNGFERKGYDTGTQLGLGGGYRVVKDALLSIGIDEKGEATHTLRRSGADRTAREGDAAGLNGAVVAQQQLGHTSERQTNAYLDRDRVRDEAFAFLESVDNEGTVPEAPDAEIIAFPRAREA